MDLEEDTYNSIFTALKHPVRRRILRMLDEGANTYSKILKTLGVETGFLNYHLESLRGLIAKDEEQKYCLSEFGEAAIRLMEGVEEPVVSGSDSYELLGRRFSKLRILLSVVVVLTVLSGALIYVNYNMSRGRDNALGWTLLQSRGYMGESISILGHFIEMGVVEYEGLQVLKDDIRQYIRLLRVVKSLDQKHGDHWREIEEAIFSLVDFTGELRHLISEDGGGTNEGNLTIQSAEISALMEVKEDLDSVYVNLYSGKIVVGVNPKVVLRDSRMTSAVNAASEMRDHLSSIYDVFNIERIH
jgi:DNA-binding transcriptional ArsR family regulator